MVTDLFDHRTEIFRHLTRQIIFYVDRKIYIFLDHCGLGLGYEGLVFKNAFHHDFYYAFIMLSIQNVCCVQGSLLKFFTL